MLSIAAELAFPLHIISSRVDKVNVLEAPTVQSRDYLYGL